MNNENQNQDNEKEMEKQNSENEVQFTNEQQAKIDELIASKIAKERSKSDERVKQLKEKQAQDLQEAIEKAEKRAKMTADERAEDERKEREAKVQKQMADLEREKREFHTKSLLLDKGISTDMLPLVMGQTDEETNDRLSVLENYVNQQIEQATKELLKGRQNPSANSNGNQQGGSVNGDNPWADKSFNLTKQMEITQKDPDLARQMIAQAQPKNYYIKPEI